MVAYASRDSMVVPGDLFASGTTGGGGCLAELWGRVAVARIRRRWSRVTWSRSPSSGSAP